MKFSPHPKSAKSFVRKLNKAKRTNKARDKMDKEGGFATPYDGPLSSQLRTVISALVAGCTSVHWDAIYEGLAMLQVIEENIREKDESIGKSEQQCKGVFTAPPTEEEIDKLIDLYMKYYED